MNYEMFPIIHLLNIETLFISSRSSAIKEVNYWPPSCMYTTYFCVLSGYGSRKYNDLHTTYYLLFRSGLPFPYVRVNILPLCIQILCGLPQIAKITSTKPNISGANALVARIRRNQARNFLPLNVRLAPQIDTGTQLQQVRDICLKNIEHSSLASCLYESILRNVLLM